MSRALFPTTFLEIAAETGTIGETTLSGYTKAYFSGTEIMCNVRPYLFFSIIKVKAVKMKDKNEEIRINV